MNKKILFFLESLRKGGKERRFLEFLQYLIDNTNFKLQIVLAENVIEYQYFFDLKIKTIIFDRKIKKDPLVFYKFYKVVKRFRPNLIHSWGQLSTFYSIPTCKLLSIPLINSQISNATGFKNKLSFRYLIWMFNKKFSNLILANSIAGLKVYNVSRKKGCVIYNGINLNRFINLKLKDVVKEKFNITTKYVVIMVGRVGFSKNFMAFIKVAEQMQKLRDDITFVAVGDGEDKTRLKNYVIENNINRFIFTGKISKVEELINISDIGMLLSNSEHHGEGVSNVILEYMALRKPIIANHNGGTSEVIKEDINGYLIDADHTDQICNKIIKILNNIDLCKKIGTEGRAIIEKSFTIKKMGSDFVKKYNLIMSKKQNF